MKTVIILRGVSGSGRSTFANNLIDLLDKKYTYCICEADNFFIKNGEYKFYPEGLAAAHNYCREKFRNALVNNINLVIVSNTNCAEKEFFYYLDLAKEYSYYTVVMVVENRHGGINLHSVPEESLNRQQERIKNSLKLR